MSKSSSSQSKSSSSQPPAKRRRDVLAELADLSGTKLGAARVLQRLHEQGFLKDDTLVGSLTTHTLRRDARLGTEDAVCKATTPHGYVIVNLNIHGVEVEFVNPFAYVYILCNQQPELFRLLCPGEEATCRPIVVYADEVQPGNPFRPDHGRLTLCVYWVFADLPDQFLSNVDFWFLGTTVRTVLVEKIPGGVSALMTAFLKLCFAPTGRSWHRGVMLSSGNSSAVLSGTFSGLLGDEKALRELFCLKGAAGTRCCPNCANVIQFIEHTGNLVGIDCHDRGLLHTVTDDQQTSLADKLQDHTGTKAELQKMEQIFGMHFNKTGLPFDRYLRTFVKPVSHYLRDWMHVIVGHGAGGTEVWLVLKALVSAGVGHDAISRYACAYTLPRSRGRINEDWFAKKALGDENMKLFASELLNMMPILEGFLLDVVMPMDILCDHIESFRKLMSIVRLLQSGPSQAASRSDELAVLVELHHAAYKKAYGAEYVKPKWHHMMHLHEPGKSVGRILSCFVVERKHRTVKAVGTWAFGNYEHTVLRSAMYKQVQALSDATMYLQETLLQPRSLNTEGVVVRRSVAARLPCGEVRRDDIVACKGRVVCKVCEFVTLGDDAVVYVVGLVLTPTDRGDEWDVATAREALFAASDILNALTYARRSNGAVRILMPCSW